MQQKKIFSSKCVTGKTGQLCVETRTLSNIKFKSKLKMDYTCKCKTRKYKTLIIKHWYNHPKIRHNKIFYDPLPRKGNKNKLKKKKKKEPISAL